MNERKPEATYEQRLMDIHSAKMGAEHQLDALTKELGELGGAFESLRRDPDHQRLYREFFRVLEGRWRESGLPLEVALRKLVLPPAAVLAPVQDAEALCEVPACHARRHEGYARCRVHVFGLGGHTTDCGLDKNHSGKCRPEKPEEPNVRVYARGIVALFEVARAGLSTQGFDALLRFVDEETREMTPSPPRKEAPR